MAEKAIDMTGTRIGHFTVISRVENTKQGSARWLCRCDCGNERIIQGGKIRLGIYSCGCQKKELLRTVKTTHGMTNTRIYRIWRNMKDRCYNHNNKKAKLYGDRGITVCDEWKSNFENFYQWSMENGYKENLSIDRLDNNKGYSPENCRWADIVEQNNNKRTNTFLEYNGETHTISQWGRITGLGKDLICNRLKIGWSVERTLTTPKIERSKNGRISRTEA